MRSGIVRLVLDTNTAVSGLIWGGVPGRWIDAAAAGDGEAIVSGDTHLLRIGGFPGIPIITPAEAVSRLGV